MMSPPLAVNTVIKPSLVGGLGIALSTLVILQAGRKCGALIANLDSDGYGQLVGVIVSDYRVVKVLGSDNAALREKEWLAAIE